MRRLTTLGLPLGSPSLAWGTVGASVVILAATMSRGLGNFDGPELALVARELGLGHPPGQPLHTMLGFVASHLPGVPPLLGLNLLSAVACSLTLIPALSLAEGLLRGRDSTERGQPRLVAATLLVLSLHGCFWDSATRIEVYSLAGFFGVWAAARLWATLDGQHAPRRGLLLSGVAMGLCASANPIIALVLAAAMAPGLLSQVLRGRLTPAHVPYAVLGGLVGLLPYGYIFAVAARTDALVWGQPVDGTRLHHYFSYADFAANNELTATMLADHLVQWSAWTASAQILPLLVLGCVSHYVLGRRRGLGGGFALAAVGLTALWVSSNNVWKLDNPDLLAYLGVSLWLCAAGVAAGVGALAERRRGLALASVAALALLSILAPPPLFQRTRSDDDFSARHARAVLDELPPDAILVTQSDHLAGAILYLQRTEGLRPDVAHLIYGLASSSWYWELLYRSDARLKPVPLRGPGGRVGRIARFLSENDHRPTLFEQLALATAVGRPLCAWGLSIGLGEACANTPGPGTTAERLLRSNLDRLGAGSPPTDQLIAMVSLYRGDSLWRLGHGGAALSALRAGVPRAWLPAGEDPPAAVLDRAAPLRGPSPEWQRSAVLGDPARNLWMSARLLSAAGEADRAQLYFAAARRLGLPEAR